MITPSQIIKGAAARFFWRPAGLPAAAPDLVIGAPVSKTEALAKLRADVAVASVSADRRTVTLGAAVGGSSRGLVGHSGNAWLDLGEAGLFPVQIAKFDSATVVRLADRLPYSPGAGAAGTLSWNVWYADVAAVDVGAVVARRVPWSIAWEATEGTDNKNEKRYERGTIDIVTQPFGTGVTAEDLLTLVPMLGRMVPERQRSWDRQVALSRGELEGWLEADVLHAGQFVDQLDGSQFALTHALLAAHMILRGHQSVGFSRPEVDFYADARVEFERRKKRLRWLDANDDGIVDSGETDSGQNVPLVGGVASLFGEADYTAPAWDGDR